MQQNRAYDGSTCTSMQVCIHHKKKIELPITMNVANHSPHKTIFLLSWREDLSQKVGFVIIIASADSSTRLWMFLSGLNDRRLTNSSASKSTQGLKCCTQKTLVIAMSAGMDLARIPIFCKRHLKSRKHSQSCFIAMKSEPNELYSTLFCFFEC